MAPSAALEDANRALKRKLETEEQGKRKRVRKEKPKQRPKPNEVISHGGNSKFETAADNSVVETKKKQRHREKEGWADEKKRQKLQQYAGIWKVSEAMGGRMADIDPILTDDEQNLILAYTTSIQVFSTSDSLLVRKVSLPIFSNPDTPEEMVAARLSPTSPNMLWVASSTGRVWKVDWTRGTKSVLKLKCSFLTDLAVEAIQINGKLQDILLVSMLDHAWRLLACNIVGHIVKGEKVLVSREDMIENVRFVNNGRALAASSGKNLLFGTLKSTKCNSFDDLAYEIFTLDCSDEITCLDLRCTERIHLSKRSQSEAGDRMVIDIVIGCARGAIYSYGDLLPQLRFVQNPKLRDHNIEPTKYHWHRKAVHAVKWSQDGNYIISGGSETVLVLWQVDTLRKDVLPHLSATIENIVVSTRGSSYVVHLDDNSTMILSTAEMKPTTYISGIQSVVYPPPGSKDNLVARVGQDQNPYVISRTPAAIDPLDPTHLLLCVGNGQQFSRSETAISTPLIQTLDLSTVQGIAKQAMTRTNPTDVNTTAKGYSITEPRVTHLAYSHDGKWLATVDEWQPPSRDVAALEGLPSERREVYLKFWSTGAGDQAKEPAAAKPKSPVHESPLELVSRINAPHYTGRSETVLDLAADPSSDRYSTIGEDGAVRFWQPVIRQRDGIVVKSRTGRHMQSWACSQTIHLHENKTSGDSTLALADSTCRRSGAVSFSRDGSVLACAFQNGSDSAVYIVDTESGKVVNSVDGLIRGEVREIRVLSSQLVVLSEDVVVYNIVMDEITYGIHLDQDGTGSPTMPLLTQLAIDHQSGTFAMAISRSSKQGAVDSKLAVFNCDQPEPEVVRDFPHAIVSLITSPSSSGFLILDSAAQVWSITQSTDTRAIALAQPLSVINLDKKEEAEVEDAVEAMVIADEDEDMVSDDEMELDAAEVEADGDDVNPVVVAPQKLAELFDAAPPFAMPPIEDMFYQVTKLFSSKTATTGGA